MNESETAALAIRKYLGRSDADLEGRVEPVTSVSVGDEVVIYSRGYFRVGIVAKIGRKNAEVVYTTEGAVSEANRIIENGRAVLARDGCPSSWWTLDRLTAVQNGDWYAFLCFTRKAVPLASLLRRKVA